MSSKYAFVLLFLIVSLHANSLVPEVDIHRVQEYKTKIAHRAYRNRYLRGGIYATVAFVAAFSIYNFFKKPPISDENLKKLIKLADEQLTPDTPSVSPTPALSTTFLKRCIEFGSDVATFFCNGVVFVAQNVLFSAVVDQAAHKSDRILKFPGTIKWFVARETHLELLLDDYKGYATLLNSSSTLLRKELDRAYENSLGQLPLIIESVERILAYIEYIKPTLSETAQQEATTIYEYFFCVTNEFARVMSAHEQQGIGGKIQQFTTEITSLCNRFLRLQTKKYV